MRRVRATAVFLDTSAVVCAVQTGIPHHRACRDYRDQLVRDSRRVVISRLLRIEYAQAWYRMPATSYVRPQIVRAFRLGAWDRNPAVRETWMAYGMTLLDQLLAGFAGTLELPIDESVIAASVQIMAQHRLRSHDAIHVATALAAGVPDFATVDADFRRVSALRLTLLRDTGSAPLP